MSLIRRRKLTKNQQRRINSNNQAQISSDNLCTGVIVAHFGRQLDVQLSHLPACYHQSQAPDYLQLGQIYRCHARTNLPMLATGDKVGFDYDPITKLGRIENLLPRTSLITRPDRYHKIKPVAANAELLVIVFSPLPKPATRLIDRYLLISHITGVPALLVLNKSDLLAEHPDVWQIYQEYQSLGIDIICSSTQIMPTITHQDMSHQDTINHQGLEVLHPYIDGKLSIFAGQSGVGKSSLINALIPTANQDTNHISQSCHLGQHTTTTSRLLPFDSQDLDKGGIIDTPGIREYGIWHLSADEILAAFDELYALNGDCRFRDCTHRKDSKGCAFWQAADEGRVLARRIESLLELQQEAQSGAT